MTDTEHKIDDELIAKEAIASSPDVTYEALDEAPKVEDKALEAVKTDSFDYEPDKRNARLLKLMLQQIGGSKLTQDQIDAAEEVSAEGFGAINAAPIPRGVRVGITGVLLLGSLLPLFFSIKGAFHENDGGNNDGNE